MKKNNIKEAKGITLVALVITVIILLILAGVAISLVIGENGSIAKSKQGVGVYNQSAENDTEQLESFEEEFTNLQVKPITKETSYVGYYADTDGNGTVDGVIYADLAVGVSGQWGDEWGDYSYSTTSNLKEYTVSQDSFTGDFGTKPVLKAVGSTGTDRFYVMALKDVALDGTFTASKDSVGWYWYNSAHGNLDESMNIPNEGEGSDDFGQGKSKTKTMVTKWNGEAYGTKNAKDVWNIFKDENNESGTIDTNKWFIPSKGEWSAFGGNLEITVTNYVNKGLSDVYWSSSQGNTDGADTADFNSGYTSNDIVLSYYSVRLSTTF